MKQEEKKEEKHIPIEVRLVKEEEKEEEIGEEEIQYFDKIRITKEDIEEFEDGT